MNPNQSTTVSRILDSRGNPFVNTKPVNKQAVGLYGSINSYPNWGRFRPRYYTLGDTSQGLDTMSRELLVRWSREMAHQLPFIQSAVRVLADFSIGDAYLPQYSGTNKEWWKEAEAWLLGEWYPRCSVKGAMFDFQTSLRIESTLIDIDGDYLCVYGEENGLPKFQIIQNNRIRSNSEDSKLITEGPMAGTILSDGVYLTLAGRPVAFHVQNAGNLVNGMTEQTADKIFSARDATLISDPRHIDKMRGVPTIGSAILQALSIQELDQYLMEKIKIEATIALIEKTPTGEAPLELQQTLDALANQNTDLGPSAVSPNTHAVDIVQGPTIRYIHAEGGDLKTLGSSTPGNETSDYITRIEGQILSTLGTPHQLVFSTEKVAGRVTTALAELFRSAVRRRQHIMDKRAKFAVNWALAKAMDKGLIPMNDQEDLSRVISFTHPKPFTLDAKYDNAIILNNLEAGLTTLNQSTNTLYNKTAEETLETQKQEQIMFYTKAQEVAKATGVGLDTVIAGWKGQKLPPSDDAPSPNQLDQESD